MNTETTLQKSANLPQFLQDLFKYIDKVDFEGLKGFFSDDFRLYFGALHPAWHRPGDRLRGRL